MQLPCQWHRCSCYRQANSFPPHIYKAAARAGNGASNRCSTNIARCKAQLEAADTQAGTQVVDKQQAPSRKQPSNQPTARNVASSKDEDEDSMFTATIITGIDKVSAEEWDQLVAAATGGETIPFLSHTFLRVMEESGSACRQTGWLPCHLLLRVKSSEAEAAAAATATQESHGTDRESSTNGSSKDVAGAAPSTKEGSSATAVQSSAKSDSEEGVLVGAVPMYLKSHSFGEYVYDSSWAQLSSMVGESYYPKLQVCVPFSPVTCPRLLARPVGGLTRKGIMRVLGTALLKITDRMDVSGIHISFLTAEEAGVLEELGYSTRLGIQFHWDNDSTHSKDDARQQQRTGSASTVTAPTPRPYASFEEFLAALKQKKRKSIRQERKAVSGAGLRVRRLTGAELRAEGRAIWDRFHEMYTETVDRKWGNNYLTRKFFHMLGTHLSDQVLLVIAEEPITEDQQDLDSDEGAIDVHSAEGSGSDTEQAEPEGWGQLLNTLDIKSRNIVRRSVRAFATAMRASPAPAETTAVSTGTTAAAAAAASPGSVADVGTGGGWKAVGGVQGGGTQEEAMQWKMVAASLNLIGSRTLYGRNWAAEAEASDGGYPCLHFELCYYQAQEEAIARGLPRVEAGAQGMHKLQRGYLPQLTYSSHYLRHPALSMAIKRVVAREQGQIMDTLQELTLDSSPYKDDHTTRHMAVTLQRLLDDGTPSIRGTLVSSLSSFSSISTSTDSVEDAEK